jgi:histo-blood group ABO system transferase
MAKIALCVIATNAYIDFTWSLLRSADKYFLRGHDVEYHLFTNKRFIGVTDLRQTYNHLIQHEPWPAMTLKRYHIMSGANLSGYDYVYYIDADMLFVAPVGDEIFGELVGVQHPGFYRGGGSWETRKESNAYVAPHERFTYIAGGFQGGWQYCTFAKYMAKMIDQDSKKGITAVHNDESHYNAVFSLFEQRFNLLSPSYCMVEEPAKRKAWGIDHLEPKIIALKKDHKKYQK